MAKSIHIICVHCKRDPGTKNNPDLWDGFLDMDTNEHVCSGCRKLHYQVKSKQPKYRNLYSEFPVSIHAVDKKKQSAKKQLNFR